MIYDAVMGALSEIAPEVDPATVDPDVDLVQQVDLDSMDVLNLMVAIKARTGVDIPERDYPRVATVTCLVDYLGGGSTPITPAAPAAP